MKKLIKLLVILTLPCLAFGQSEFRVEAGQTVTITKAQAKMFVDRWVMEDNSTIVFAPDVKSWEIYATEASFGKNTRIIGRGKNGRDAKHSTAHGGNGSECKDGGRGGNGQHGTIGQDGVDVKITMGLLFVTDLQIDVRGGKGGDGGNGANGGRGGRASCGRVCSGQEGGNGGTGGDGMNGGRGGNVTVEYWIAGTSSIASSSNSGLRAITDGGQGGIKGQGGQGGPGGAGKKCPPFDTIERSGGTPGHKGKNGRNGSTGKEGVISFMVKPTPRG